MRNYSTSCSVVHLHSPCLPLTLSCTCSTFPGRHIGTHIRTHTHTHTHSQCQTKCLWLHLFVSQFFLSVCVCLVWTYSSLYFLMFVSVAATKSHVQMHLVLKHPWGSLLFKCCCTTHDQLYYVGLEASYYIIGYDMLVNSKSWNVITWVLAKKWMNKYLAPCLFKWTYVPVYVEMA